MNHPFSEMCVGPFLYTGVRVCTMKTEPYYLSSIDSSLLSNGWAKDDLIYQQNKTPQNNKTTYSVRPVCDAVVVVHDGAQDRKRVLETQNVVIQT